MTAVDAKKDEKPKTEKPKVDKKAADGAAKEDKPKADKPKAEKKTDKPADAKKEEKPKADKPKADKAADAKKDDKPKADKPKADKKADKPADAKKEDKPKADKPKADKAADAKKEPKADKPKADKAAGAKKEEKSKGATSADVAHRAAYVSAVSTHPELGAELARVVQQTVAEGGMAAFQGAAAKALFDKVRGAQKDLTVAALTAAFATYSAGGLGGALPTAAQVTALHAQYDTDKKGTWGLGEFAAWWGTATDAWSVLLRDAIASAAAYEVAYKPEAYVAKGTDVSLDVTVGSIDAKTFKAGAGIYATALPSNKEVLGGAISALHTAAGTKATPKELADPDAIAVTIDFTVQAKATAEDVQEVADVLNAAATSLLSDAADAPIGVTAFKATQAKAGTARLLRVQAVVIPQAGGESGLFTMLDDAMRFIGVHDDAPLFEHLSIGAEFGVDGAVALVPGVADPVGALFAKGARGTVTFQSAPALAPVVEAMSMNKIASNTDLETPTALSFLTRGVSSVASRVEFESLHELTRTATERIATARSRATVAAGDASQTQALPAEAAATRMRLNAIAATAMPAVSTVLGSLPDVLFAGAAPKPRAIVPVIGTVKLSTAFAQAVAPGKCSAPAGDSGVAFHWADNGLLFVCCDWDTLHIVGAHAAPVVFVIIDGTRGSDVLEYSLKLHALKTTFNFGAHGDKAQPPKFVVLDTGKPDALPRTTHALETTAFLGASYANVAGLKTIDAAAQTCSMDTVGLVMYTPPLRELAPHVFAVPAGAKPEVESGDDEGDAVLGKILQIVPAALSGITSLRAVTYAVDVEIEFAALPLFAVFATGSPQQLQRARFEAKYIEAAREAAAGQFMTNPPKKTKSADKKADKKSAKDDKKSAKDDKKSAKDDKKAAKDGAKDDKADKKAAKAEKGDKAAKDGAKASKDDKKAAKAEKGDKAAKDGAKDDKATKADKKPAKADKKAKDGKQGAKDDKKAAKAEKKAAKDAKKAAKGDKQVADKSEGADSVAKKGGKKDGKGKGGKQDGKGKGKKDGKGKGGKKGGKQPGKPKKQQQMRSQVRDDGVTIYYFEYDDGRPRRDMRRDEEGRWVDAITGALIDLLLDGLWSDSSSSDSDVDASAPKAPRKRPQEKQRLADDGVTIIYYFEADSSSSDTDDDAVVGDEEETTTDAEEGAETSSSSSSDEEGVEAEESDEDATSASDSTTDADHDELDHESTTSADDDDNESVATSHLTDAASSASGEDEVATTDEDADATASESDDASVAHDDEEGEESGSDAGAQSGSDADAHSDSDAEAKSESDAAEEKSDADAAEEKSESDAAEEEKSEADAEEKSEADADEKSEADAAEEEKSEADAAEEEKSEADAAEEEKSDAAEEEKSEADAAEEEKSEADAAEEEKSEADAAEEKSEGDAAEEKEDEAEPEEKEDEAEAEPEEKEDEAEAEPEEKEDEAEAEPEEKEDEAEAEPEEKEDEAEAEPEEKEDEAEAEPEEKEDEAEAEPEEKEDEAEPEDAEPEAEPEDEPEPEAEPEDEPEPEAEPEDEPEHEPEPEPEPEAEPEEPEAPAEDEEAQE